MFALFGTLFLVAFIYVKPQEFISVLERYPMLYIFLGLAVLGLAIDVRIRQIKVERGPHLPYVIAFYVWCLFTGVVKTGGAGLVGSVVQLSIAVVLYFILSNGIQTFKALELVFGTVATVSLFVAVVAFHQGFAPLGCAVVEGSLENLRSDGRPCQVAEDCYEGDAEPGANYQCERMGLFGTVSVGGGRVRYRGILRDPNEVALATGTSLPLLIGRVERKPSFPRIALLLIATMIVGTAIIFTQSRGGQLVFLTALGAYFIRKFGMKGIIAGAVLAIPVLLLGGRSGLEAEGSASERTEILWVGLDMLKQNPILGVGFDQFTQHHFLTAHNAYLLPLSESGPIGLFLFLAIMYISFKIPFTAVRRYEGRADAAAARTWGMALVALFAATGVGIFFLSFTYHHILWIYIGLSGAFYRCVRTHDPTFEISLSVREVFALLGGMVLFVVMLFAYTRTKM